MANSICDGEIDDIFFIAIDDFSDLIRVSAHHIFEGKFLIYQNMVVEARELLFLINAEFPPLTPLKEAVQSISYHHLYV